MNPKETITKYHETVDPRQCVNNKLRRLSRMTTQIYESEFKKFDLRSSQVSILMMVWKKGETNQKDVADFLFIDQSTMSRDLKKLNSRKLITISKGQDARYSVLELTENGHKLLLEVIQIWSAVQLNIENTLGSFSLANLDTMTEGLRQFIKK